MHTGEIAQTNRLRPFEVMKGSDVSLLKYFFSLFFSLRNPLTQKCNYLFSISVIIKAVQLFPKRQDVALSR